MNVKTADPEAQELDEAFAKAMASPVKPKEAAAPPEVDRDAPHGRGEDGTPLAPYGYRQDGAIRLTSGGRPRKDGAPRVSKAPDAPLPAVPKGKGGGKASAAPEVPVASLLEPLGDLHDAFWMGLTGLSQVGPKLPVVGRFLNSEKIGAEAFIWRRQKPNVLKAAAIAAEHNAAARARLQKLATGGSTWVLMAGLTLMPLLTQSAAVFGSGEEEKAHIASLAEVNQAEFSQTMEAIKQQVEQAAEEAQAA